MFRKGVRNSGRVAKSSFAFYGAERILEVFNLPAGVANHFFSQAQRGREQAHNMYALRL